MKLLLLGVSFPLLLFSFLLGKDANNWAQLNPSLAPAKDNNRANASFGESQHLKPVLDLPWIYMYAPVRSCHQELREKYGEFSPPEYPNGFEENIWCNWTVWAGARKHIVIYIKGFTSDEGCDKNEDKIFFNGVSSLAENMVIYACWKKEMYVFATYAQGVHVVFLMRHSTNLKKEGFMGRYYIFKHRETKPPDKDALGSKLPTTDPSEPNINSISLSQKRPFMPENESSSLSSSHGIDKATDLPKSLQANERNISMSILASKFVWQVTNTLPLISESLHLLHVSVDSEESSCSQKPPEQLMEVQNPNVWGMGIEEMSVELGEPIILSNGLFEVPYFYLSLIEPSGPVEGMEHPSRTLSTSLLSFLKDDLQMVSTATQPDYHALDTNSWTMSHDPVAFTEVSTWGFKEITPMSCQTSSLAQEAVSLQINGLSDISLLTPEQDLIGTKKHMDYVLLPSEISERGRLQGHPESSVLLFSDDKLASDLETETALISEHIAKVLDVNPILESSGQMASELKVTLAATRLRSILESDLHLRHRSEQSSVEILLDILSENPGGSTMTDLKSSQLLNAAIRHEISLFPSETTLALLATTGLGLSPSYLLGTMETLLSTMELEPLLSYSPTVPLLLAVPDLDSITPKLKHDLSSTTTLTYPFISVGLDTILSTPAIPLEPTFSDQESIVSSIIVETLSEELEHSISAMERAWSPSATVVETALELEMIATVLEPVLFPATSIKSSLASETISAFSHVNEIVPPFGLSLVGADPAVTPLRSSCCQPAIDASEQENAILPVVWSSSLPVAVMEAPCSSHHTGPFSTVLEHLFPSIEVSTSMKQPLLERRDDDVSAVRPGDKDAHFTPLNLAFKSEFFPSFDIFTVSALSPLNGFITEISQFVPILGKRKQPESLVEYDLVSNVMSTQSSLPSETQVMQPITCWGRPCNAEWNLAGNSLEFTVADLNVVGTFVKAQTQKKPLDLQTLQISSDFENKVASKAGHLGNHMDLELPWLLAYLPAKDCHVILRDEIGIFSPPVLSSMQSNIWCNWTIWAGPQKHILIYIEGFEGSSVCEENRDKIIFQGVSSSVESKVVYACRNHGTLIFATQAVAVHVVFLSKVSSQNLGHKHFKGRYYIFSDYETSNSTGGGSDAEELVLKSNSSTIFSPKSYAMHSRHVLDFAKMRRKLGNETRLPMTSRQAWNNSSNAMSLQGLLSMPLSNATHISPLKFTENVTLNVLDVKMIQIAKPSFDDIKTSPNNLKKTLVWASEKLESEVMLYKPTISSAFPYLSQKFRTMTKLMPEKDTGIVSESSRSEVVNHITTHQKPADMKDSGRTIFGKYILQNGITFPQVSLEEQGILIPPPKSTPMEKQEQVLHTLTSYDGSSRKTTKVMNFQHLELKEALEGEQRDNQDYRQRNGSNGQYVAVAAATGGNKSHKAEFLTTGMPENLAIKRKSHVTTLDHRNVLSASLPRILKSDLMGTASLNSWDVLLRNLKNIQAEATITSYPSSSGNTEHSLQKGTTPQHPYSLPDWGSSNEGSLGEEHKNSYENISVFRLHENYTILKSQHNPGDVLFEITFGVDHKGEIPHNGSEQEKALIESIKLQVQEKVKLFSNKVKEIGLKEVIRKEENEMRRGNGPNLIFTFWLHLKPEEKNITHFIHSRLKDLSGESMGTGEIQLVSIGDVNECSSGIELCGDEAICLNGYGTYICQCKEEYEDHSLTKLGTLCVHSPKSGIGSLYSYAEILVGTTVFFIFVLVVVVSVLCSIVKKRCIKKDGGFEQSILSGTSAHLHPTAFQQDNISNLLSLDPTKLKLRAKSPDWPLQPRTSPSETYRISIEQSECL